MSRFFCTFARTWLGQIKQALTIYREDIRQRLNKSGPKTNWLRNVIIQVVDKDLSMEQKIYQSCAMLLTSEDMFATKKDGNKNEEMF